MIGSWQDDKEYSGYSLAPNQIPYVTLSQLELSPSNSRGLPDNKNWAPRRDTPIGKYVSLSGRRSLFAELQACSGQTSTQSFQEVPVPRHTAIRRTPGSDKLLNSEPNPFVVTPPRIGSQYGPPHSPVICSPFRPMSEWYLIVPCEQLELTTQSRCRLIEGLMYFGVVQVQANLVVRGMKQESVVTLSALDQSFGTVIKVKEWLSLMNFVEASMSHICLDGLTVTQYVWKSKDLPDPLMLNESGLLQM